MHHVDELDRKLIYHLRRDGRSSNIELAKRTGVSEGTIRRRFRKLVDDGVILVAAVSDPAKVGLDTTAVVGLQVAPADVESVAEQLAQLEQVDYVAITTGAFDIIMLVALGSPADLAVFLQATVGAIAGVRRTETFINLSVKKHLHPAAY